MVVGLGSTHAGARTPATPWQEKNHSGVEIEGCLRRDNASPGNAPEHHAAPNDAHGEVLPGTELMVIGEHHHGGFHKTIQLADLVHILHVKTSRHEPVIRIVALSTRDDGCPSPPPNQKVAKAL